MKEKIEKGLSWEEIKAKEPMLDQEEFEEFKLSLKTDGAEEWTKWGKDMREKIIGNHLMTGLMGVFFSRNYANKYS